jgi:hypothetical protein
MWPECLRAALQGGRDEALASETELRPRHPRLGEQASPRRPRRRSGGAQPSLGFEASRRVHRRRLTAPTALPARLSTVRKGRRSSLGA